ncbi:MAG: hypothetical protein PHQ43_05185 [Dehalococcoidales bacterium]|nr:hypothetical protein [Dehalococcoidales bacterium]
MSKKSRKNKDERTGNTRSSERDENGYLTPGHTANPHGRPPKTLCFTDTIRDMLTKRKRFRRPDGSLMEASELELIALKVVRELRMGTTVDNKLLAIVLDRIEGKPKESVELNATVQAAAGIDPRDVLLQRLSRLLQTTDVRTKSEDDDDQE